MVNAALKTLIGVITGAVLLNPVMDANPVQAATITYNFEVNVTLGEYVGQYDGQFRYDDSVLTGIGDEIITPSYGNLSLLFTFLNKTYTAEDELEFPTFPGVYFRDGQLYGLSFLVLPPRSNPGFFLLGTEFMIGNNGSAPEAYFNGNLVGFVTYWFQPPDPPPDPKPCDGDASCAAVPEPSELAGGLVSLGLVGLGLRLRRRLTK
ncbi:hypothetical protein ACN4EK_11080 [Pantanalinema rosaneae CENA516]|uniref:hypothetical protein n=1 Tax=Pantanalinema rosaneae TaxID=1620701 RepID=UPI003D6E4FC8